MHSRQVNFFLNLDDQIILNSKLLSYEDLVFSTYQTKCENLSFEDTTLIENMGFEPLKIILLRESDIKKVVFRRVENRKIYSIDTLKSPVIEYSRCYVSDDIVRRGRLYFTKDYYDEKGFLIKKEQRFLDWANNILDEVRKGLTYEKPSNYFGKGAMIDRSKNIKMRNI